MFSTLSTFSNDILNTKLVFRNNDEGFHEYLNRYFGKRDGIKNMYND